MFILGEDFRKFRVQRFLVRQWIHVTASLRCQSTDFWEYCFRIQCNAWFSVVHAVRLSRSFRRRFPCLSAEAGSHGLAVQQTAVVCARLVLLVFYTSRCVPPVIVMPSCLVGRPVARSVSWPVSTRGTVMLRDGRRHPCRDGEAHPHGLVDRRDFPVAAVGQGDRWPCCAGRAVFSCRSHARCVQRQVSGYVSQLQFINKVVHTPVVAQSLIPVAWQTIEILLLPYTRWLMSLLCRSNEFHSCRRVEETVALPQLQLVVNLARCRRHPGRGAEAVSHRPACLADHRDTPVALRQGDRRSWCEGL